MSGAIGEPNALAMLFFFVFIAASLGITWFAARRTKTTEDFYAAGRSVTAVQNGLALAGDYMSAASFLGIAGLVALSGFDGLIYSIGFLVGWPVVLCLIAEPLRNLGRYTFADVVAFRLQQRPVRVASAFGGLAVIAFYLIAQMVGAGNLIRLLFGLSYEMAVVIVGCVMLAYVLFGGMLATTWVQIVKAVLLMSGAGLLALLVLAKYDFNPLALFADAAARFGPSVLAPGRLVSDPIDAISLGIALMFGTAGLPHILMRFYTVPDARTARVSVAYATAAIGLFYLFTFILGFGAMVMVGQDAIRAIDAGGNMAAPLLAEAVGGQAFLGFIAAVAFATILAVVAGLDAGRRRRPVARHLGRRRAAGSRRRRRAIAGRSRRHRAAGHGLDLARHRVQGPERGLHGGTGICDRGQRQLPRPAALDVLEAVHDGRRGGVDHGRHRVGTAPHLLLAHHPDRSAEALLGTRAAAQSRHHFDPAQLHRRDRGVARSTGSGGGGEVRGHRTPAAPRRGSMTSRGGAQSRRSTITTSRHTPSSCACFS